jgi:spore coat polysaccharide biosynthesis protein SpsF
MDNIVAIIQARMGSSRLPGKVLMEICAEPMLAWVVKRTQKAKLINEIIVATTTDSSDEVIENFCQANHFFCFRGSSADVLDRYYQAAKLHQADVIVRLTADCPFIDPELIDNTITAFLGSSSDFAANRLPPPFQRSYPIGLDVEVVSMAALERAWRESTALYEREHVLPYLYKEKNRFKVLTIDNDINYGEYRWTVDTKADLSFIRAVVDKLDCRMDFSWKEVIAVLEKYPELTRINAGVRHKSFTDVDDRVVKEKKKK